MRLGFPSDTWHFRDVSAVCFPTKKQGAGPRDRGKVMTFTRNNYDLQALLRPIKSEL